ncbi:MAG: BON domain-containing protein [Acidobacteriota bacterium]|nr:BON domain-containing protein [Acidobacteriota bacterium]
MRYSTVVAVVALAIAFAAGGCGHKANDAALITSIKAQMFSDPQLKDANLQVAAVNGEVTLSGSVPNDAAHLEAYKIASQTAGVVHVNDKIAVDEALATPAPAVSQAPPPPAEPSPVTSTDTRRKHEERAHRDRVRHSSAADQNTETAVNTAPPQQDQSANSPAEPPPPAPASAPPPTPHPQQYQIPSGSTLSIRMIDAVDSSVNQPGEIFHASLDQPLVSGDRVVVPKGADVYVRLVSASSAGRMTGSSELRLGLVKLEYQGQSYPLVSSTYSLSGASRGKDTAKKVGAGAVLGTLIGAIAGGGKGAAIGAGVGAAAGGGYQAATHGKQVRIPSETKLDFQLEQPVTVTVQPSLNSQ